MIQTKNLVKTFIDGDKQTTVLKGIDFRAESGEFIAIMGRSGAGKSTFMYQMSLLDQPTEGEIILNNISTKGMTEDEKGQFRLNELGYVFQDYALLPDLTALENVALPLLMLKIPKQKAYEMATASLERIGLEKKINNLPSQLSGGEQQRVSISRAVAHSPKILFADEPTANLDHESSNKVMEIFKELHKQGQTIIMVTHEEEYGRMAERIVRLDDGRIIS
ncbi:MAG: transporter, ATP-binding protein [Candidatus Taylorbacteria bacterium]|nr:transporter, ATP-binding protein [Candidatus Taylorbacteria bacterium]